MTLQTVVLRNEQSAMEKTPETHVLRNEQGAMEKTPETDVRGNEPWANQMTSETDVQGNEQIAYQMTSDTDVQGNEPWANQLTPETRIQGKADDASQGNVKSDVQENAEGNIQENMQDAVQGINLNPEGEIPHTNQAVSRDKGRYTRLQRHLEGYERLRLSFVQTEDDSGYLIPQKKFHENIRPQSRNDGDAPTAVDIPSCQRFTFEAISRETGIDAGRTRPHSQYVDTADYCTSFPGHHDNKKTDKRLKNTYPEGKSHDYIDIVDDVESCPSHTETASNPADETEPIR